MPKQLSCAKTAYFSISDWCDPCERCSFLVNRHVNTEDDVVFGFLKHCIFEEVEFDFEEVEFDLCRKLCSCDFESFDMFF